MKKLLLIAILGLFIVQSASARARIPVCMPCEYIDEVSELTGELLTLGDANDTLSFGYKYEQYNILWLPLWNTEGEYCLTNKARDTYYELDAEGLALIGSTLNIDTSSNPLSLWNKLGGKLLIILAVGGFIWSKFGSSSKKDDESKNDMPAKETPSEEETTASE